MALGIQSMRTGETRVFDIPLQDLLNLQWMPGGRAIVGQGRDLKGQQGLFTINAEDGSVTALVILTSGNDVRRIYPALSPDGRQLFFRWAATGKAGISARDLATGTERTVMKQAPFALSLSPDGRWLALMERAPGGTSGRLSVMPSGGGPENTLAGSMSWASPVVGWSADSTYVFALTDGGRGQDLWRVPTDGSAPAKTGITVSGAVTRLSPHPDGRRLALSVGSRPTETRVLENIPSR
jgi:Tol biopolymer transport system component